jgi:hypothetical protein
MVLALLYLGYYLPGMWFVPAVTHVQVSVVALAALTVVLARAAFTGDRPAGSVPA